MAPNNDNLSASFCPVSMFSLKFMNFRENIDTGQNEALKLSLFGAIGAVSYNFKF